MPSTVTQQSSLLVSQRHKVEQFSDGLHVAKLGLRDLDLSPIDELQKHPECFRFRVFHLDRVFGGLAETPEELFFL